MFKCIVFMVTGFGLLVLQGCATPQHIKETPLKFQYNEEVIEHRLGLREQLRDTTDVLAGEASLSDNKQYLKEKYAAKLGVMPNDIQDYELYEFIDKWLGTPFATKGFSEKGMSAAYFIQVLYSEVYRTKLSKSPLSMFKSGNVERFTGIGFLKEGDLVFLRYSKDDPISDVALYLQNGKIITSTRERGLAIFDFENAYFQKRYAVAARRKPKEKE